MSRFAKVRRVFFVEEPVFTDEQTHLEISPREDDLTVVVPRISHHDRETKNIEDLQRELLDELFSKQKIEDFVLWFYTPMAMGFASHLKPKAVVYDCMDELSGFKFAPPELLENEAKLFQKTDLVFTGGQSLYEAKKDKHKSVYAFPSSIDAAHFKQARNVTDEPTDQLTNSHGQTRRYIYNSRGALIRFIGADGRDLQFNYNLRGEMQGIFDEQTARVIYKRNQTDSLAKIQPNTNLKNFWQFQKVNYSSQFANSTVVDFCVFGDGWDTGGDGGISWGNWDEYFAKFVESASCYDPFGGMFGGGGSGGGAGGVETCSQCKTRETRSCQTIYTTALGNNTQALGGGTGMCVLGAIATIEAFGIGGLICQVFVSGGTAYANYTAAGARDNCLSDVAFKCQSTCNPR
jgi:YD repeat-containing protein